MVSNPVSYTTSHLTQALLACPFSYMTVQATDTGPGLPAVGVPLAANTRKPLKSNAHLPTYSAGRELQKLQPTGEKSMECTSTAQNRRTFAQNILFSNRNVFCYTNVCCETGVKIICRIVAVFMKQTGLVHAGFEKAPGQELHIP